MIYVGIDVHKTRSTLVAYDPATGDEDDTTVLTDRDELLAALEQVPEPFVVGVEATREAPAVCRWLQDAGLQPRLLDPTRLKQYAKGRRAKNDRIDARLMAQAMAEGMDVECYLAEEEVVQLRALTRGRQPLVAVATKLRNLLRALLCQGGLRLELSDLRGKAAMELMPERIGQLEGFMATIAALYWWLLEQVEEALATVDEQIDTQVTEHPVASRLAAMPGIGPVLALTLVAEIGRIDRFASYQKLHSYAGVVPTTRESGDSSSPGALPHECNKRLRWAAVMAAQGATRCTAPNKAKSTHRQIRARKGPNTAKIAAARKVLTDVYFAWQQVVM